MIVYNNCSLFNGIANGDIDAIAHGCNTLGIMGKGVAKVIKERFEEAYIADQLAFKNKTNLIGSYSKAVCYPSDKNNDCLVFDPCIVYNIYTQSTITNKNVDVFNYEGFEKGFSLVVEDCIKNKYKLGIPLIGHGNAHGKISKILDIVRNVSGDMAINIFIPNKQVFKLFV